MKLLPWVVIGIFWIGAYVAGGWVAVGILAFVGILGELLLFVVGELQSRHDRHVAGRRLEDLR
jgi:hypothetical protein